MDFSPKALRAQWKAKLAEKEALDKKLDVLRAEWNGLAAGDGGVTVTEATSRKEKLRPKIVALQEQLYPIDMELAALARALGGRTGDNFDAE